MVANMIPLGRYQHDRHRALSHRYQTVKSGAASTVAALLSIRSLPARPPPPCPGAVRQRRISAQRERARSATG